MEERIKKFMDYKGISASELADSIGVLRSNVTHVLKARNKPSFQFIEKMLQVFPELNAKWLLLGTGNMLEVGTKNRNLFDQLTEPVQVSPKITELPEEKPSQIIPEPKPAETIESSIISDAEKKSESNELKDQFFSTDKPIERLVVFFKDQTFKVYNPSK